VITIKSQNHDKSPVRVLASNSEHGILVDNREGAFSTDYQEYPDEFLGLSELYAAPKILEVYTDLARLRAHFPQARL
jgi:hypothetical protein